MKLLKLVIAFLLLNYSTVYSVETFPDPVFFNSQIVIPRVTTDPAAASANAGSIWFNRADQKFKGDNGSVIVEFGAGGGSPGSTPHNIIGASHTDTSGSPTGVAILRYVTGVNTWQPLAKGTANQFLGMTSSAGDLVYRSLLGTTNQVIVTQNSGNITLSLPQNLNITANVQFAAATIADIGVTNGLTAAAAAFTSTATLRGVPIVTTTEAQTLSGPKTLTSPIINSATINNGTLQGTVSVGSGLGFTGSFNVSANIGVAGVVTAGSFVGPLTGNAASATQLASATTPCPVGQYARGVNSFGNSTPCVVAAEPLWNTSGAGISYGGAVGVGLVPSGSYSVEVANHINNLGSYWQGGVQGITLNPAGRFNSGGCTSPSTYVQSFIVAGGLIIGVNLNTCPSSPGPGD